MRILFSVFLGLFLIGTGFILGGLNAFENIQRDRATAFICGASWAFWQPDQRHQYGKSCDGELVNAYVNGGLIDMVRGGKFP